MFDIKILPKIIILLTMIFGTGFIGNIGVTGLVVILLIILVLTKLFITKDNLANQVTTFSN